MNGIIVASATPYNEDGLFNPSVLEELMRRHIKEGAAGFFAGGSAGECMLLTENERIEVFETACGFNKETQIIAHVAAISTNEAVRYAKAAKSFGAQYIAAAPPTFYRFSNAQIAQYYYDISDSVDMPVMIYNFPGNTGRTFDLNDANIRTLIKSDKIWGIKHTDLNLYLFERIHALNPKLVLMNGYDETMIPGLSLGASGSIGSTFNVMLPHYLKIYNSYHAGEFDSIMEMQTKANNIMEAFCNVGLIAAIKHVLTEQGFDVGEPRRPFTPLTKEQKESIMKVFNENVIV